LTGSNQASQPDPNQTEANGLAGLFMAYAVQLQQALQQQQQQSTGGITPGRVPITFHRFS
jgi:pantothenate kinase type III